jgi:flagellin
VTNAAGNAIDYVFEFTDGTGAIATATDTTTADDAAAGTVAMAVVFDPATDTPQMIMAKAFAVMRDAGFTVNTNEDGSFEITHQSLAASTTDVTGLTAAYSTTGAAESAFDAINTAITDVNTAVAALGTSSNYLDASAKFNQSLMDALTTGVGQLVDADLAEESANLQALQTRQQLGIQALSIANQQSGSILSLFRG